MRPNSELFLSLEINEAIIHQGMTCAPRFFSLGLCRQSGFLDLGWELNFRRGFAA